MSPEEQGAVFDEFSTGGLLDDADVIFNQCRFARWDYNGTQAPVLALNIKMQDVEGEIHDPYLSSGDLKFFVPSSDGKRAVPVGNQQKLNINTNAVQFLISIMNADVRGELANKLKSSSDISVLDGLKAHVVRKAQPKRAGIIVQATDQAQRDRTTLVVDKILAYPWEPAPAGFGTVKQAAQPAQRTGGNGAVQQAAQPAGSAAGTDTEEKAVGVLLSVLAEAGGQIKKTNIAGKVYTNESMKAETAPVRNAILGLVVNPQFLGAEGRPWQYDAATGTVSLG